MNGDRRQFLSATVAGSLLPVLVKGAELPGGPGTLTNLFQGAADSTQTDEATRNFWLHGAWQAPWREELLRGERAKGTKESSLAVTLRENVRQQTELFRAVDGGMTVKASNTQNSSALLDGSREPYFFYYDSARKAFRRASDLEEGELLDADDAQATFAVTGFRPSIADKDLFANISGGYLRVDLQQQVPLPGLLEALAWSATAVLLPDQAKKLPPLNNRFDLGKNWGSFQAVLFPRGVGSWRWNFMVQEKESWWRQVLGLLGKFQGPLLGGLIAPLGLPAMAITAFKEFNNIYANLISQNSRTRFVVQSQDLPMVATKKARQDLQISTTIPLRTGAYIIVPRQNADAFNAGMKNLRVAEGYVIDKNREDHVAASRDAVPEVTYLTLEVAVKKPSYVPVPPKG